MINIDAVDVNPIFAIRSGSGKLGNSISVNSYELSVGKGKGAHLVSSYTHQIDGLSDSVRDWHQESYHLP